MSLKVIHTRRDGTKVPIRVSIWDAFKGVPDPKPPKPPPCTCCGKVHYKSPIDSKKAVKDGEKVKNKDKSKTGNQKEDDDGLTKDDRIILRMKGENPNAQWKDIAEATSNYSHGSEVKARFKVISHHLDKVNKNDNNNAGKKKDKKSTNNAEREEANRKKKEEGQRKKAENLAAKEAEEQAKKDDEVKPSNFNSVYDRNKGCALAAKHFDKTGLRISWREALKLAE